MKFDLEVVVDREAMVKAKMEEQLASALAVRKKTLSVGLVEYQMYTLLSDYEEVLLGTSWRGKARLMKEQDNLQIYGEVWDVDMVTGEVSLNAEVKGERYWVGSAGVVDIEGDESRVDLMIPGKWLDPQLSEEEVQELMRQFAVAEFAKVKALFLKDEEKFVKCSEQKVASLRRSLVAAEEDLGAAKSRVETTRELDLEGFVRQQGVGGS